MVARERHAGLLAQLDLALALAEPALAPAGVEQVQHLGERLPAFGVIALEHLVHRDPKPLMQRLSGGNAQDPRELVSQRAAAVGLYVRGRQRQADALARQKRPQRRLAELADPRPGLRGRVLAQQRVVERRGLEDLALKRRGGRQQAGVDVRQGLADALAGRALEQRGKLEQLQIAHHPVGDVKVGVQPQLAQTSTDSRDARKHLLAHQMKCRLEL